MDRTFPQNLSVLSASLVVTAIRAKILQVIIINIIMVVSNHGEAGISLGPCLFQRPEISRSILSIVALSLDL